MYIVIINKNNQVEWVEGFATQSAAVDAMIEEAVQNGYANENDDMRLPATLREEIERSGGYVDGDYSISLHEV